MPLEPVCDPVLEFHILALLSQNHAVDVPARFLLPPFLGTFAPIMHFANGPFLIEALRSPSWAIGSADESEAARSLLQHYLGREFLVGSWVQRPFGHPRCFPRGALVLVVLERMRENPSVDR